MLHGFIVVEYSPTQNAFHKSTVPEMIRNNLNTIARGINNGYRVIGMFVTHTEADEFLVKMRETLPKHAEFHKDKTINQ